MNEKRIIQPIEWVILIVSALIGVVAYQLVWDIAMDFMSVICSLLAIVCGVSWWIALGKMKKKPTRMEQYRGSELPVTMWFAFFAFGIVTIRTLLGLSFGIIALGLFILFLYKRRKLGDKN